MASESKFNRETMWPAVLKLYPKAKRGDDVSDEQLAESLRKKFAKVAESDLADCTECGESSPATDEYECCPFCGEGGVADPEPALRPAPKPAAKPIAEVKPAPKKEPKREPKNSHLAKLANRLDESVKTIRTLQRDMLANGYELGRQLIGVFESESWKARRAEDGGPAFRSFKSWCAGEAGFTTQMARNYMAASKEYDKPTYQRLGVSKLAIIARLPAANRAPVIKAAMEGADLKTIQQKVSAKRQQLRGDGKAGPGRPVGAENRQITAVVKVGKDAHELGWFARDPDKDGNPLPLDAWEPHAWAFLDLGNGVSLHLALDGKPGAIKHARVSFTRRSAATATVESRSPSA